MEKTYFPNHSTNPTGNISFQRECVEEKGYRLVVALLLQTEYTSESETVSWLVVELLSETEQGSE
jgi:hypothetical protein